MKNIWMNVADSFEAAERFDRRYYQRMSPTARLEIVQFLRETYYKLKNGGPNGSRKRLRRVIKIVK